MECGAKLHSLRYGCGPDPSYYCACCGDSSSSKSVEFPLIDKQTKSPINLFQNFYKFLTDLDQNIKMSLQGAAVVLISVYIFVKVNFCMFRAARGILTIIGFLTVCSLISEKYESLPEPIVFAMHTMKSNSLDMFVKIYNYFVKSLN